MFPNNSSSFEISSVGNGSTRNSEDNGVDVTCEAGQRAEPASTTCGNEPVSEEGSLQLGSQIPVKPVPDMRDTNERTNDWPGDVGSQSSMSSTSLASSITSTAAQSTNIESTMQDGLFSKDALPSAVPTLSASEVATCSRSQVKPLHTGCDTCGCCNHHPDDNCASCLKSEACSHVCSHINTTQPSAEGIKGTLLVEDSHMSVISSSSGEVVATEMEFLPPSHCTSSGAHQSTVAVFACDIDSSSSNKLHQQRVEPSLANGSALPTELKQHHQNQITPAANVETVEQSPGYLIPSWEKKLTTGALSDQDNNYNKANHSNNSVKEHSQKGGGDAKHSYNAWSQTPLNIPEAEGDGKSRVPQAIQATVQGINDSSNPPASFNNNVNFNGYDNINDNGTAPVLDMSTTSKYDYACLNLPSDKDREANLPFNNMNAPNENSFVVFSSQNKDLHFSVNAKKDEVVLKGNSGVLNGPASNVRWGIPKGLGLRGGGESSLNNGTTGWGTPPSGNNNSNNNANNSNNNPGANSAAAAGWGNANATPNSGNNQAGQAQWGAPNNNRPNTGNNQNAVGPQSAVANPGAPNKTASQMVPGQSPPQSNAGQPASTPQPGPQGQTNQPSGQQPSAPGQAQQQPNPAQPPPSSQPPPQNGSNPWTQGGGEIGPNHPPPAGGAANNNNGGGPGNGSGVPGGLPPTSGTATPSAPSTKQQLEQLNTMREALFSQDGWGGQNVNQDSGWDIPSSPEPVTKDNNGGPPVWKLNANNGTDLWEANLRNGGQPPPQTQQKTPWGHTPTTNIGGTWGEDDEVSDSSNMWTGVPANPGPGVGPGPQWGAGGPGGPGPGGPGPAAGMWGGPKKDEWNRGSSNWGEPRGDPRGGDPRMGMDAMGDPRDMRGVGAGMDPRDLRGGNDPRDMRGVDMRGDPMRGPMDPMRDGLRDPRDLRGMGDMRGADPMMRGDPRGISGRLNGGVNDPSMWGQPPQPPHHNMPHHQQSQPPRVGPGVGSGGNFPGGVNQWAGPPPKDMGMPGAGSKPSGWEEPSPPAQRRNIPNYDDGTSLWGQQQNRIGGKVSHWKDMPTPNMGRSMQCPPGMPQNRMPNAVNMKPDNPLWSHHGRNGSWDGPHDGSGSNAWVDDPSASLPGLNNWIEPPLTPSSWGGPKPKNPMNPGGWVDGDKDASWGQPPKSGPKPITKEMVWASKQFRMLTDMGYKKDDVENALRVSNMNLENALEMLNANRMNMDAWRGHEDHGGFDIGGSSHPAGGSGSAFSARGFPHSAPPIPFAPPGGPGLNNQPSLINMNNANPSLTNISPALVQKMLMQQPPPQQPPSQQSAPFNQSQRNSQNQPSAQQLQMLVKQIQMAVGAGYLNQQILNQPLSPQTLLLLNQLLQQIKVLQNLTQQHAVASAQKGNPAVLHISVQLTKTKQQISNLQNQIQAQQAMYVKHMPQQPPNQDYFKPNMHDPMGAIPNFGDLTISKEPQVMNDQSFQSQQSRLNQWKLPSLDKDPDGLGNEFSRAPGTTSKAPGLSQSHSSPNINPILSQGDGPWASVSRSNSDTGWPDSGSVIESGQPDKDWPITSQSNSFSDLVPEFEPGKPWKGNQLKSIEDDPSITPGSVVRSPLSLAALKEPEMFSSGGVSKTSPTSSGAEILPPLSLSSSTWSYNNTASSTASSFASPLSKLGPKGPWGDGPVPTAVTSELWGAPPNKPRGPPPGLISKNSGSGAGGNGSGGSNAGGSGQGGGAGASGGGSSSNGWGVGRGAGSGGSSSWGMQGGAGATPGAGTTGTAGWGSTWLLLKNLTPQIDGSTLKTLCLQHGPLQSFHLYLNHGIALAKYQSREEANKAQAALNNCVLSNTTIFAESPSDSEVHNLLSHLGGHGTAQQQQSGAATPNWGMRSSSGGAGANSGAPPAPGKAPQSSQDTWGSSGGSNSSQLWPNTPTSSVLWGSSPMDSSGDQHRATPSAFLPGDLLGGESM